ncbi:SDR family oxidoreductase [Salinisphaera hydrothermalis]|uniref:SDR family oxidoreductase n=1 Tax=Salinisphaera hydrothermalis TaxID=563188 RepID=UPI00333EFA0A
MKTVLITGCSSGFGLEIARYFLDRDWQVVATMRTPRPEVLPTSDRLRLLALDVTDPESVAAAVEAAGPIDVLVNNAGVGAAAPFELTEPALARALFETNTLGTMAMTQAVLPQFRSRGAGTVINVTSTVTLKALPLLSMYTASKAAVNAFTACMAIELAPFGIAVHIVLPGRSPETRFGDNAHRQGLDDAAYADLVQQTIARITDESGPVTHATDVAEAVWRAATDPAAPMRIPAGADALEWARDAGWSVP